MAHPLNAAFAAWVQAQQASAPDADWSKGCEEYVEACEQARREAAQAGHPAPGWRGAAAVRSADDAAGPAPTYRFGPGAPSVEAHPEEVVGDVTDGEEEGEGKEGAPPVHTGNYFGKAAAAAPAPVDVNPFARAFDPTEQARTRSGRHPRGEARVRSRTLRTQP
jgi:hypothetical protein